MSRRIPILFLLAASMIGGPAFAGSRDQVLPEGLLSEFGRGNPVDLVWYKPPSRLPTHGRDDRVLVLDAAEGTISSYTPGGELEHRFGSVGTRPGQLMNPQALAVDREGRIYVADTGNDRVQVFDANGSLLQAFGSTGEGPGELDDPRGVAVVGLGLGRHEVAVADTGNDRLQTFTADGQFDSELPLPRPLSLTDTMGTGLVVVSDRSRQLLSANELRRVEPYGLLARTGSAKLQAPVDFVQWNELYVADAGARAVLVFEARSGHLRKRLEGFVQPPRAVLNGTRQETASVYVADGRSVREIALVTDSPLPFLEAYRARLAAGDLEGALEHIHPRQRALFHRILTEIGKAGMKAEARTMGRIETGRLADDGATLYIVLEEEHKGKMTPVSYPVQFVRSSDGGWLIYDY